MSKQKIKQTDEVFGILLKRERLLIEKLRKYLEDDDRIVGLNLVTRLEAAHSQLCDCLCGLFDNAPEIAVEKMHVPPAKKPLNRKDTEQERNT